MGVGIGAGFGLSLGLLSLWRFDIPYLDSAINFLGAPASIVTFRLNLPEMLGYVFLVTYFALSGFVLTWLSTSRLRIRWIIVLAFLAFLIVIHTETLQQLNREFDTFFNLFVQ